MGFGGWTTVRSQKERKQQWRNGANYGSSHKQELEMELARILAAGRYASDQNDTRSYAKRDTPPRHIDEWECGDCSTRNFEWKYA